MQQPIHVSTLKMIIGGSIASTSSEDTVDRVYITRWAAVAINQLQQEARERCKIVELRIPAHAADLARSNVPSTSG